MEINWKRVNRKTHHWGSIVIALPVLVVICSGLLLQIKKEIDWIQPVTLRGETRVPTLAFDQILAAARQVPEADIKQWGDINRLDVRPGRGVIKIRAKNNWEIQIDQVSGKLLGVNYRRSDLIESIHDGSFFHEHAKLWLFLPASVILLVLWGTGMYLFALPYLVRQQKKRRHNLQAKRDASVVQVTKALARQTESQ